MTDIDLATAIRAYLEHPGHFPGTSANLALLAVVEKCEQMRAEHRYNSTTFADEFEAVIARALGITS